MLLSESVTETTERKKAERKKQEAAVEFPHPDVGGPHISPLSSHFPSLQSPPS